MLDRWRTVVNAVMNCRFQFDYIVTYWLLKRDSAPGSDYSRWYYVIITTLGIKLLHVVCKYVLNP
jgi:hypothetical protein